MSNLQYRKRPQNILNNQVTDDLIRDSVKNVVSGVLFKVDHRDLNDELKDSIQNAEWELSYHDACENALDCIKHHLYDELLNIVECQWYHLAMSTDYKKSLAQALDANDVPKLKTLLLTLSNNMLIHSENFISTRLQNAFNDLMGDIYNVYELEEYFLYYATSDLVKDMKKLPMGHARTIDTNSDCDIIILSSTVLSENSELLEVAKNRLVIA